jgi:hypothetical protein
MSKSINDILKKKKHEEKKHTSRADKFNPMSNPKFMPFKKKKKQSKGLGTTEFEQSMKLKKKKKKKKEYTNIDLVRNARKNYQRDLNIFKAVHQSNQGP